MLMTHNCTSLCSLVIPSPLGSLEKCLKDKNVDVPEFSPTEWWQNRGHFGWTKASKRFQILSKNWKPRASGPGSNREAKNLGVIIDNDLTFEPHIRNVAKIAFFHLWNIAKVRPLLQQVDAEKLMHGFITSRLDYCNSLLSGLPQKSIQHLQFVQNAAARVLTRTKNGDHISPALLRLHWLPVRFRIDLKVFFFWFLKQ